MKAWWGLRAVVALGLLLAASGQGWAGPLRPAHPDGPAMWRLATETATVYFLGSFHLLPPDVEWRDGRVDRAMAEAQTVAFEVDQQALDRPEVAAKMLARASLPAGRTLRDEVGADTYAHLTRAVAGLPVPMALLERSEPWFVSLTLVAAHMMSQGADPELGVDSVLAREAAAAGKRLAAFETVDEQFDLLETMSREDPDFLLMDTVRYLEDGTLLERTLAAWRSGDVEALAAVMAEDLDRYPGAYDRFIVARNVRWLAPIEAMIRQGGTHFVVVGAGHLVGDGSVIALLEAKGYAVERF